MAELFKGAAEARAKDEAVYQHIIGLMNLPVDSRPEAFKQLHALIHADAGIAVVNAMSGPMKMGDIAKLVNVIGFWAAVDLLEKTPATVPDAVQERIDPANRCECPVCREENRLAEAGKKF